VGINVSDVAAGGMLMRLKELGIAPGKHFWITSQRDLATDQYAESAGIRVIRYSAEGGDHSELSAAIEDLVTHVSEDEIAPPVKPTMSSACPLAILPAAELCRKPAEDIRLMLNARASQILNAPNEQTEKQYEEFCKDYSEAIYRAWFVDVVPPKNILFGNKIIEAAARGAFARVYRAEATSGEQIAIKVLHGEIRDNREMLQSFRRGVRSMQILSDRKVNGMVAYREASEIPACVVMDFIEGPNLKEAVDSRLIEEWSLVLRVALDLARIIRSAHLLPERVLHRDIRPANIMLKNFHQEEKWEVVVLDFDLSWHREAMGLSVDTTKSLSGYLAPEQIERSSSVSTRNALVDSFGLGMTLYFLRSGHEPMFAQHRHQDWRDQLNSRIASYPCSAWRSIPARYARVITNATRDKQNERWDMSQIESELTRLDQALQNPSKVESAELLCDELVARSSLAGIYIWEEDENTARVTMETGVSVSVKGDETARAVRIALSWTDDGTHNRKKVGKWIPKACDKANAALKRVGWRSEVVARTANHSHVAADIPVGALRRNLGVSAEALSQAVKAMQID
jgi:serine/threonine protein kinase